MSSTHTIALTIDVMFNDAKPFAYLNGICVGCSFQKEFDNVCVTCIFSRDSVSVSFAECDEGVWLHAVR